MEFAVTAAVVTAGLANKRILFIDRVKSAAITLGMIGMMFCVISVGKIFAHPSNPMTIIGILPGVAASVIVPGLILWWMRFAGKGELLMKPNRGQSAFA